MKLYIIAGHGAGDPGAVGNGCQEAECVRALARKMVEIGGDEVGHYPYESNAYYDNALSWLGTNAPVIELHMDAASSSDACGAHVVIGASKTPTEQDIALASFVTSFWPGRPYAISYRSELQNPSWAQARGIDYRLVELGFITNAGDCAKFNENIDEIARQILMIFGIGEDMDINKTIPVAQLDGTTQETPIWQTWGWALTHANYAARRSEETSAEVEALREEITSLSDEIKNLTDLIKSKL